MKKGVVAVIAIIVIAALGAAGYFYVLPNLTGGASSSEELVYVDSVGNILGGFVFTANRYNALVETQETISVEADLDKKIKETFVKEGDTVKKGDKLFEYDIDEMQISLDQYRLDMEQADSEIKAYKAQIESLEKERKQASANRQLNLTNQIESLNLDIKKAEYTKETAQKNIEKLEKSIENTVVKSNVDGIVKSVNDPNANGYVMITASGDYRVKAIINETNIYDLAEGDDVIIRSRIDNSLFWRGTVTTVDTSKPITNNSNSITAGLYMSDEVATTKYPVYIELDSSDGLLVGQHVTVEKDTGIADMEEKEGLWLYDYYICDADGSAYVWAESGDGKLEKRSVTLGEYDESLYRYEIKSGLSEEDSIAFPEDRFTEGMTVTHNIEDVAYSDYGEDGMEYSESFEGGMAVDENAAADDAVAVG